MFGLLESNDGDEATTGLDGLRAALQERQTNLSLEAEYMEPYLNDTGEHTAVFPIATFDGDRIYGSEQKEFIVPDDGLDDEDSALVQFLANANGVDPSDVTFDHLANIESMTANATLEDDGTVRVETPNNTDVEGGEE